MGGFVELLLIAVTRLNYHTAVRHTVYIANKGPNTAQRNATDTISFVIISKDVQMSGHYHCNHKCLKTATQPQDTDRSV